MSDTKRPSFPWYPGDHRRDANVQACSYAARGLWLEMMNLMHDGEPYGHLTAGGKGLSVAQIAQMTGGPIAVAKKLLKELEDNAVFARTTKGVIYCRRMVKDEEIRRAKKAAGRLGGNPALLSKQKDKELDIQLLNKADNHEVKAVVNHPINHPPAVAVAVASAFTPSPSAERFLESLPAGHSRQHWLSLFSGWQQGTGLPGRGAAIAEDIDTGLAEYLAGPKRDYSAAHVRTFVARARDDRVKAKNKTNGHHPSLPIECAWVLMKVHRIPFFEDANALDVEIATMVTERELTNDTEFRNIIRHVDLKRLRKMHSDREAVSYIESCMSGNGTKP